jgi:hypothetical protein
MAIYPDLKGISLYIDNSIAVNYFCFIYYIKSIGLFFYTMRANTSLLF